MESITKILDNLIENQGLQERMEKYKDLTFQETSILIKININQIQKDLAEIKAIQDDYRLRIKEGYYE